jgi:hypothetical protein
MPKEEARRVADYFVWASRQNKPFLMFKNTKLHKQGRLVILEQGVPVLTDRSIYRYRGIDRTLPKRYEIEGKLRYVQKMEAIGGWPAVSRTISIP